MEKAHEPDSEIEIARNTPAWEAFAAAALTASWRKGFNEDDANHVVAAADLVWLAMQEADETNGAVDEPFAVAPPPSFDPNVMLADFLAKSGETLTAMQQARPSKVEATPTRDLRVVFENGASCVIPRANALAILGVGDPSAKKD